MPDPKPYVLVVEDEEPIAELVAMTLRDDGFDVRVSRTGADAWTAVGAGAPELIVLDVMLPDIDGFTLQARLAAAGSTTPILFLSARDSVDDKVRGLSLGAYDYMAKPFSTDELVARVRSVLRRVEVGNAAPPDHLTFADLVLDEGTHEVSRGGVPLQLTPTEFRLLHFFLLHPRQVLSKAQILEHVWRYDFDGNAHIVENYVSYLRKQVDARGEPLIHTVRGFGYCLRTATDGLDA